MISDERPIQEVIRRLREEKGLSQSKLAKLSGVDRGYINQLEHGKTHSITLRTARALAKGLGVSADVFLRTARQETPEDILERLRVSISSTVPVYEDFPFHAGAPVEPMDYVPVVKERARGKTLEGYIARGKCLEPEISDGNIIIVDRDGQVDNGDIVAALVSGELYLARLRKIAEELFLENNDGRIKLEDCQIAAPVIEVRRRLK